MSTFGYVNADVSIPSNKMTRAAVNVRRMGTVSFFLQVLLLNQCPAVIAYNLSFRCNGFGLTVGYNRNRLILKKKWNFRWYPFETKNFTASILLLESGN